MRISDKRGRVRHVVDIEDRFHRANMPVVKSIEERGMDVTKHFLFPAEGEGRRTSDSGPERHVENSGILWQRWPRANQAHIAAEDVIKLRQLINFKFAQNAAEGSNTAVAILREAGTRRRFCGKAHAAKFVNGKQLSPAAHALLHKECRSRREQPDQDRHGQHRQGK